MIRAPRTLALTALWLPLAACVHSSVPAGGTLPDDGIVSHPDQLTFPVVDYQPPRASEHRMVLANGSVCYMAEHSFVPLVRIEATIRTDRDREPEGLTGLNGAFFSQLAEGGGGGLAPAEFEDRVAFLGARFWSRPTEYGGVVGIELLSKDLNQGLDLLFGQLVSPGFDQARLDLWREQTLASLRQRNDDTRRLERLEWNRLIYPPTVSEGRFVTQADLDRITRDALLDWQRRWVAPAGISFEVSGDVTRNAVLTALDRHFETWQAACEPVPERDAEYSAATPGVYLLDKEVNQTRVRLALPGLHRDDSRWVAGEVLNTILGGGFTSRLVSRIRSDEGLAYSVWSSLGEENHGTGLFLGGMQTKVESTLYAMALYKEELQRLAGGDLENDELERVRQGMIEEFPGNFNSPANIVARLHDEELSGRYASDPAWFASYRDRVAAVDRDAVISLAREMLDTDRLIWLLIGDTKVIEAGDSEHGLKLEDFGPVTRIPLRDPLSQLPLEG
ncbi:MAG: insulinase family protein [Calditrichaeota bacterium]|nr:insulinase family protein [Calditrichota bacterium]